MPVDSVDTQPILTNTARAKASPLLETARQSRSVRYLMAIFAAGGALALGKLLEPLLGNQHPYHTLWLAVVFSAWYCGLGPAIVTVVVELVGVWYWFLPPYNSFAILYRSEIFSMLFFVAFSGVIVALGESNRRIARKRRQAEERLKQAHAELESRVKQRTAVLEQKTAELAEKALLLDLVNDAVFIRSAGDTISYWNEGAERLYGWRKEEALGRSSHDLLHTEFPVSLDAIKNMDHWEGELRHSKRDGTRIVVASRWTTLRDSKGEPLGWLEINTDITVRRAIEDAARKLSGRLLSVQDEERRRIARELHDSLGQYLVALKMNVGLLEKTDGGPSAIIAECFNIVDTCLSEIRTISHLLHPPLLDDAGFGSAARWYVEGFGQRSGIKVETDFPSELGRLPHDVETALFRSLQEALTNVHRHSGSSVVNVRFGIEVRRVWLEIKDNGRGIPQKIVAGIVDGASDTGLGLAGMRERMRELGGTLRIKSDRNGTLLRVEIPLPNTTRSSLDEPDGARERAVI